MNDRDTLAVLAKFAAAWPTYETTADTAEVWIEACSDLDPGDSGQAMNDLIRSEQWHPSIARFRQEVEAVRYRRIHLSPVKALPSAPPAPFPYELVAELKNVLAATGARKHWHGGPNPCPVCGGIRPAWLPAPKNDRLRCRSCGKHHGNPSTTARVPCRREST